MGFQFSCGTVVLAVQRIQPFVIAVTRDIDGIVEILGMSHAGEYDALNVGFITGCDTVTVLFRMFSGTV